MLLNIEKLNKSFPGVRALAGINYDLREGEIHSLVGENGAGKSTLIEIISGKYKPDSGAITINGKHFHYLTPAKSIEQGIATVHQHDQLASAVTVAENIYMGCLPTGKLGFFNIQQCISQAEKLLASFGLQLDASRFAAKLSPVERRIVSIAKALSIEVRILILDEPTAALGANETNVLFKAIKKITKQGIGVIYISHYLDEVLEISDRITVLRDGSSIATYNASETDKEQVVSEMVGRNVGHFYMRPRHETREIIFEVNNLSGQGGIKTTSFNIREGEIFGIGGLVGSGRSELARLIFGVAIRDTGSILYKGEDITPKTPMQAIKNGIGFLSEDRKELGLVLGRSVKENTTLVSMNIKKPVFLNLAEERRQVSEIVSNLNIKTVSIEQIVINLSGGNQQKVALGKWLLSDSNILIFDDPTVGIDVGAKQEIYTLMDKMARKGKVVIMISSDIPELLTMSDRIGLMRKGQMVKILSHEEATQEKILQYITGLENEYNY